MGITNSRDDTERYRLGYPDLKDDPNLTANAKFYKNEIKSVPDGDFIDTIHAKWFGNYGLLERHHAYIQWIFPIREEGVNHLAQVLQLHEAQAIRADKKCLDRVRRSYEMMLDFYGIKLVDKETGQLERAENYKARFNHLNSSFHNYLRITRLLKSLGELGFEHYKLPFIKFVLTEIFDSQLLFNCKESCVRFWAQTLRSDKERAEAETIIKQYLGVDELSEDDHDIDNDIAEKWLGSESDDEDDEEESEIQQALEDLISADDDDDELVRGEVIGVKESVEISVSGNETVAVKESVEITLTQNESQPAELTENNL
jgi:hypothetical protein